MKKAAVIMGSDSDFPVMSKAMKTLKDLGIPFEAHVMSAHRTPEETAKFAKNAEENGFGVLIAGAGMSAALAGSLAANTTLPVIGVPLRGGAMDGLDALLSTSMMPSGIPVACVAIDGAKNAAYLAAEILALSDPALAHRLKEERALMGASVEQKDRALQEKVREL
ncbi:MAG: 5-(carboxyamino)imidazole ribonucleotide mutase [Solobacterium sp.]|jgi:5-(carboxyamino)imidazole ribonucleotide mutase|nr:5-(carboxyamino)imidazole ribonucleotide mutase [Solobacterium sp.]